MKQYSIVPTEEELAAIGRDLRFYPASNSAPSRLTLEQVAAYNDNGFVAPVQIFDSTEIGEIRTYFDRLLEQTLRDGGDSYSISSAHLKHARVYDLLTDPRIVDCAADLLGDEVIAWGSHFFCKMPGDGKAVAWHQDASYWPLSPSKAITLWLAIDDADAENGCVQFVAGSHRLGHLTYRPSSPDEHNVLNQSIDHPEQYGTIVLDELKAGCLSIHSDLLLHGSEANCSDRRRCGLTLRYCAADVRAELGWNEKGVVVRGTNPTGHWHNNARPA